MENDLISRKELIEYLSQRVKDANDSVRDAVFESWGSAHSRLVSREAKAEALEEVLEDVIKFPAKELEDEAWGIWIW